MKKILSLAAFALLLSVTLSGLTACDSAVEEGETPTSEYEARQMLLGQWKQANFLSILKNKNFSFYYREITTTQLTNIGAVNKDAEGSYAEYAGKYVTDGQYKISRIEFNQGDPTGGSIYYIKDGNTERLGFKSLTSTSVIFDEDGEYKSGKLKDSEKITYVFRK